MLYCFTQGRRSSFGILTAALTHSNTHKPKQSTTSSVRPSHRQDGFTSPTLSLWGLGSLGGSATRKHQTTAQKQQSTTRRSQNRISPFPVQLGKGVITRFLLQQCPEPAARTASWRRPALPGRSWTTSVPTILVSNPSRSSSCCRSLQQPSSGMDRKWLFCNKLTWRNRSFYSRSQGFSGPNLPVR